MDFVVPNQVIDRTKGIRPFTFFEGGVVGHVGFADPFDERLAQVVKTCGEHMQGDGVVLHETGTVIVMGEWNSIVNIDEASTMLIIAAAEGPQFSTRAESHMYRSWGGSVINMSTLPEAKLAREAELSYQVIAMATDYDCWHSFEDVNVLLVHKYMKANSHNAKRLVAAVLDQLSQAEHSDLVMAKHWEGFSQGGVKFMTKPEGRDPEALKRVAYLFPNIWND